MDVSLATAINLFIGIVLTSLSAVLLYAGARRVESWALAFFLALVGFNFAATGIGEHFRSVAWVQLAHVALALDPLFLLLFVMRYAYRRVDRASTTGLWLTVGTAVTAAAFVIFVPERTVGLGWERLAVRELPRLFLLFQLWIVYALCWVLAVRAFAGAPTAGLQRRARWGVFAIGIAVLPRWGRITYDVGLPANWPLDIAAWNAFTGGMAVTVWAETRSLIAAAFLMAISLMDLPGGSEGRHRVHRILVPVFSWVAAIGAVNVTLVVLILAGGPSGGAGATMGLRWLFFGVLLAYGVLAYEVVEFRRTAERALGLSGGIAGAGAAALAILVWGPGFGLAGGPLVLTAALAGLAAASPASRATRSAIRRQLRSQPVQSTESRRLELYRASAESAWARGPPNASARSQLERDRRAYDLSTDEARTLEHIVATDIMAKRTGLKVGEEPLPGLILEAQLGEGGHGRVFAARRQLSGDRVVVKELRSDVLSGQEARRQLMTEARALKGLHHPNIVELLDVHAQQGRYILVLEFVGGASLADRLKGGPLSESETRRLLEDVVSGLGAAHANGIVHRDVKPANIILGADARARLTDFGIASLRGKAPDVRVTVSNLDALGGLAGTLAYMAPEQAKGHEATRRTDLYAMGLVAYECLTGEPALDVMGCSMLDALQRAAEPALALDRAPSAWRPWLARALQTDPARRFANAAEMRAAIPPIAASPTRP